ncbi:MAG TPA: alpha/beta fold hydrolase [Tahibacter sp.]|uniref:esterase/lipase family protein n=1 Tax=Tahibacter sp. TaxID=2056211 RepID=UPI002BC02528|nr:alpha/beta fold hydrolase [Tahibacter sp.]HSX60058.1 alpha/beta fold hydrolase [Tahibacter sp.]
MKDEAVILIHGVWMRAFSLLLLRRRLREAGFVTELFDYASVFGRDEHSLERLGRRIRALHPRRVHLVGHSLGGLVAVRALHRLSTVLDGRVVCLGSPLNGSTVARRVPKLLGCSTDVLCSGLPEHVSPVEVGVIAGTQALGIGQLMGAFDGPNDGTVAVAETRWPGAVAHCEVNTSHTGLVLSGEAADLTVRFLRSGRFDEACAS